MIMKTAVLINMSSNNGNAGKKWLRIESVVKNKLPVDTLFIKYGESDNFEEMLKSLIEGEGITRFISAGGDGSFNLLVNSLAEISGRFEQFSCGAIGLGSSNDFLKPVKEKIDGIPLKINFSDFFGFKWIPKNSFESKAYSFILYPIATSPFCAADSSTV